MAKRFTDTELFDKAWFMDLSLKHKCLWEYLAKKCNHAGIIEINFKLATAQIGTEIELDDLKVFGTRLLQLDGNTFFITTFYKEQYGVLNSKVKAHAAALKILTEWGLVDFVEFKITQDIDKSSVTVTEEFHNSQVTTMDTDMDMNTDMNMVMNTDTDKSDSNSKLTSTAIVKLYNSELAGTGEVRHCPMMFTREMQDKFNILKGFQDLQTFDQWRDYFSKVKESKFLTHEKKPNLTLLWLLDGNNAAEIISGKYAPKKDSGDVKNSNVKQISEKEKQTAQNWSEFAVQELKENESWNGTLEEYRVLNSLGRNNVHDLVRSKKFDELTEKLKNAWLDFYSRGLI